MIALLVVLAVLWLAYTIIDSAGPVGIVIVVLGAILALTVAGCATVPRPQVPEPASLIEFRAAIDRIVAYCNQDGPKCTPPAIEVVEGRLNQYIPQSHTIRVSHFTIEGGPIGKAIMAHELSHAYFEDSLTLPYEYRLLHGLLGKGCILQDQVRCEMNANAHAPQLLIIGWGMDPQEALSAVWSMLLGHLHPGEPMFPSHPDWCAELHDFERRYEAVQPTACTEN